MRLLTHWGDHVGGNAYSLDLKLDVTMGKLLYLHPRVWYGWLLLRIDEIYERLIYLNGFYAEFGLHEDKPVETFFPRG